MFEPLGTNVSDFFHQNTNIFFHENASVDIVREMAKWVNKSNVWYSYTWSMQVETRAEWLRYRYGEVGIYNVRFIFYSQ